MKRSTYHQIVGALTVAGEEKLVEEITAAAKKNRPISELLKETNLTKEEYNRVKNLKSFKKSDWTYEPKDGMYNRAQ